MWSIGNLSPYGSVYSQRDRTTESDSSSPLKNANTAQVIEGVSNKLNKFEKTYMKAQWINVFLYIVKIVIDTAIAHRRSTADSVILVIIVLNPIP